MRPEQTNDLKKINKVTVIITVAVSIACFLKGLDDLPLQFFLADEENECRGEVSCSRKDRMGYCWGLGHQAVFQPALTSRLTLFMPQTLLDKTVILFHKQEEAWRSR